MQFNEDTSILRIQGEFKCIFCPKVLTCSINDMRECIKIFNEAEEK